MCFNILTPSPWKQQRRKFKWHSILLEDQPCNMLFLSENMSRWKLRFFKNIWKIFAWALSHVLALFQGKYSNDTKKHTCKSIKWVIYQNSDQGERKKSVHNGGKKTHNTCGIIFKDITSCRNRNLINFRKTNVRKSQIFEYQNFQRQDVFSKINIMWLNLRDKNNK